MADRSISISLEARVQGFVAGMRTAQQSAADFSSRLGDFAERNEQHLDRVGKAGMVMGGALLAGVALAVKSAMEFDSALAEVQSSTHATAGEMDLLREAAITAGADTAFSAKEAANAIDEMSKAGVSTADILNGGLTGALSLAAAGSLAVADAASIAATSLTQFKLSGTDLPHIADLLAAGAGKAQGSVQDLGLALSYAGVPAHGLGISIEDTTGALALFASNGIIGEKAGTALRGMLVSMTKPAKQTQAAMDELGVSFFDASGEFIGLQNVSGVLKDKLGGLTSQTRNAALAQIFGNEALGAAQSLYDAGPAGVAKWTEAVNDAGYAAVTASIKQDTLAGDIEKLGGSFDSVLIKGGSGVAQSLRGLVQGAEDLVDAVGKIPTPMLNAGVGIAGIAGGALLLGGALLTVLPQLMAFRASMAALAAAAPRAAAGIGTVGKAAGIALISLVALQIAAAVFTEKHTKSAEEYGQALLKVSKAAGSIRDSGLDGIFGTFDKEFGVAVSNVDNLTDAVERLTNQSDADGITKAWQPLTDFLGLPKPEIPQLEARLKGLGEEMGNLAKNGAASTAAKSFQELTREFEANGQGAKEALGYVPGYKDALLSLGNQAGVTLEGQDLLDFAMGKVPASMTEATTATQAYADASARGQQVNEETAKALEKIGVNAQGAVTILNAFVEVMQRAGLLALSERDSQRGYAEALMAVGLNADGTGAAVGEMGLAFDNSTAQGIKNQAMFDGVASAGMATTKAMADATDAFGANVYSQEQLQANLGTTFANLVTAAGQFGITGGAADDLARKVMGIPPGVNINSWMSDFALKLAQQTTGELDKLDGRSVTTTIETINRTVNTSEYKDDPSSVALDPSLHATGGRVNYLAAGGRPRLFDMRPRGTDTVPTMLTPGEFVVNAKSTAANLSTLEAINSGYQYKPAPAAPAAMGGFASPAPLAMTGTLVLDSGELMGTFTGIAHQAADAKLSAVSRQVGGMRR